MTGNSEYRITIGIGACLTGQKVRYDGSSKPLSPQVALLCQHFDLRAFCPEVGIGMPVPRPPIHLVDNGESIRVLDVATHRQDYTAALSDFAATTLDQNPDLCGYILVQGSPSCGLETVKRFSPEQNILGRDQQGQFAATLRRLKPLLPLEADNRLCDPGLRECFFNSISAYSAWKGLLKNPSVIALNNYYHQFKHIVLAHDNNTIPAIEQSLALINEENINEKSKPFIRLVMTALAQRTTRRSHTRVLQKLATEVKHLVSPSETEHIAALIENYRSEQIPLEQPVAELARFYPRDNRYISNYLNYSP